ncbi:hypothetical protein C1645_747466 [Glomus cerebriforme]|uniref:Uncharacterized protein n=1 Tax=Glomus cerebriforme TaxID=658196 RepID=A0A397TPI4_9GLOM|nr:hypothetical protein C1645_747466 [Glomus cerebriforme]
MIKPEYIESCIKIKRFIKNAKIMISEKGKYEKYKKTLDLKCIYTHLRPGDMNCFASDYSYEENKLQKLSKSLQKIYLGYRHIILSVINEYNYDRIILCETTNRTKQYLIYNLVHHYDHDNNPINRMIKVGLLSCIPFSKRLEMLQKILFIPDQELNQEVIKSLIEADLAIELNGLCGLSTISKKMKLVISDILLTQLELFRKFCEFVKFIISKENSISSKHTDWAISVFAKLKILLHYSKNTIYFESNARIYELKKIIYDEYLKIFENRYNQNNSYLLSCLKIKVKHIKKKWKKIFKLRYTNKEKLNLFRNYMINILKANNLKTDFELLNDDLDIILLEDDYKIIEKNHKETFDKIKRKKYEHKEQVELLESQANFENMAATTRNIGSEDINVLFNHGIEANNCGSEDTTAEITNQGLEAFNFGSENTTMIMNQGIEILNYGSEV